ncbi:Putative signal transduction histidine kinase [Croceitalea dokdonensis DOKDO 023]|uniref:histidine kinase n=1 Tax=Croceitalea dokdonensis DOKDO 023 TaxID=1300341 RepID=A0A0P7B364_9FLAO|nr:sensor histidine kinase [Croceitalea dokdonensis]KPM32899.1 Putative signal transduction histidine kinase [Croceitalea dokdonensis DOKDO 023]
MNSWIFEQRCFYIFDFKIIGYITFPKFNHRNLLPMRPWTTTFLFTLVFALAAIGHAQKSPDQELDSLLQLPLTPIEKVKNLHLLASKYRYTPPTKKILDTALFLSQRIGDNWMRSNSYYALGNYYFYRSQLDSCLSALDLAEEHLSFGDHMLKASILSTRSGVYSRSGDVLLSIDAAIAAKGLLEQLDTIPLDSTDRIKRKGKLLTVNNSLANLYLKIEDMDLALTTYEEAFSLASKLDNPPGMAIILSNKGELLHRMERYTEALKVSKEAKKLKEDAKLPLRYIALSNYNMGKTYHAMDSIALALALLNKALDQSQQASYERGQMLALAERGSLYLAQDRIEEAKNDCKTAYELAEKTKEVDAKISSCNCLYQVEEQLGNTESALGYHKNYTKLKDSLFSEKNVRNLTRVTMQYEFDKKQEAQALAAKARDRKRNLLLAASGLLVIFALILASFFKKRLQYRQTISQQEQSLKNQEIARLEQQQRITAIHAMVNGQEKERARIAKDLHDGLGGLLSSVKSHFIATHQKIKEPNIIEKTTALIDEACTEVRRISHNMMPHALAISGLEDSVRDIAERLEVESYEVTLEIQNLPKMDHTQEVMVYRLIQEIIANIKKHAEAKHILIQLYSQENRVYLTIEDDGKGFNVAKARKTKGLGLENMESRAAYLNGSLDWDSKMGSGTTVNLSFGV